MTQENEEELYTSEEAVENQKLVRKVTRLRAGSFEKRYYPN
ncbi:MAG: hypothetical protein WB946_02215 [Halobacteriota archaeon]